MNNIKVIETQVDVSKILDQLNQHPGDWGSQKKMERVQLIDPEKYETTVDVLQLIMGATKDANIKA